MFAIERETDGHPAAERLPVRHERSTPIIGGAEGLVAGRAGPPPGCGACGQGDELHARPLAVLRPLPRRRARVFDQQFFQRALRGLALGRKAWLFAGSNRIRQRAAFFNSLIVTAKLNDVDPQAWLADVLGRITSHPVQRLGRLLPWNCKPTSADMPSLDAAA